MAALKELVAQGWKSDNGFRAGYLNKLEDAMRAAYPGTDLKGVPHINSKICAMKKNYYSLSLMLGRTGFGFNANGTIDCTDEEWAEIVKKDPNARLMRDKPWPLIDDWKLVFGKDRATGEHAEDLMDAVTAMYRRENIAQHAPDGDYHVNMEEVNENEGVDQNEGVDESVSQNHKGAERAREETSGGRKRKAAREETGGAYEMLLREMMNNTGQRLETLANRVGYDFDIGKARKEVFEVLKAIPELSLDERFDVCELLAYKVERLEIFMGLPEDARPAYAKRLLEGRNK
ncbi:uncharacterized protein LOC130997546 [Salvia miltiorrhiza]|uniref:uncharacterized protein LOC130997546 n=1 Tax=Salvia miltiorrhiza TaxID=226208 RepID=UPI0025ABAC0E|nr:uncharacterized protein LOC130997546 [Salvia miltiorrhiza]